MTTLRIGEVARQAGVGVETIRYYERQGLLEVPQRRASGYRQYDQSVISRLQFVRRTKTLGFTLAEIRELLELWFGGDTRCEHIRARAARKIGDIEEKIRSLQKMKRSLAEVVQRCEGRDSMMQCPLWEGLETSQASDPAGPTAPVRKARRKR